jgi:hypothetical protein
MFEVLPEPEFRGWFDGLPEAVAEEVTASLELVARAGNVLEPAGVSRALLWYDGVGPPVGELEARFGISEVANAVREIMFWYDEVARTLESEAFRERLSRLSPAKAGEALRAVERLKQQLRGSRLEVIGLERSWGEQEKRLRKAKDRLQPIFLRVLDLVGIPARAVTKPDSGLRELAIASTQPPLRILYGLDVPNKRLVAIMGEPLTRAYYGDSVRLAEARWAQYTARAESTESP